MTATRPARAEEGFTLIELLVVIAVIALLIGILLPVLARARMSGAQTRELAAIKQLGAAYAAYATDNRDRLLPGYLRATWAYGRSAPRREFIVSQSPNDAGPGSRLVGGVIRPYPWRLMPYVNFAFESLFVDRGLLRDVRSLPDNPQDPRGMQRAVARSPSFGMNTTYVGGDAHRGGFHSPARARWGAFYILRMDQPLFPSRLLVFAAARGTGIEGSGRVLPGYHRIEAPWHATETSDSVPAFVRWTAPPGRFNPRLPTGAYGHLDFRYFDRAATVTFDGHAEGLTLEALSDMRRWSNQATQENWCPQ